MKNKDTLKMEDFLRVEDFRNYSEVCHQMEGYITALKYQFGAKKPPSGEEEEEEAEPEEVPPVGFVPDLLNDAQMYQWAGIGFGQ